jgi:hypothetical protein
VENPYNPGHASGAIGAIGALDYKGAIDCSTNPNYPAADLGHVYIVSVGGHIGGASGPVVTVGDILLCKVDGSAAGDYATVGTNWWDTVYAIKAVEDRYVRLLWFEEISEGTSGTISPPTGGTIVLDQWAAGIDAITSTITSGYNPSYESAQDVDGTIITATLDGNGHWAISGTPSAYPIAILYVYDVKLINIDRTKSLVEMETDEILFGSGAAPNPTGIADGTVYFQYVA